MLRWIYRLIAIISVCVLAFSINSQGSVTPYIKPNNKAVSGYLVEDRTFSIKSKYHLTVAECSLCMVEAGGVEPTVRKNDHKSISERSLQFNFALPPSTDELR